MKAITSHRALFLHLSKSKSCDVLPQNYTIERVSQVQVQTLRVSLWAEGFHRTSQRKPQADPESDLDNSVFLPFFPFDKFHHFPHV